MAAASKGLLLSSYIVSAALERATMDFEQERTINVSKEFWKQLIALLNNPEEPTPALKHLLDDAFDFRQR